MARLVPDTINKCVKEYPRAVAFNSPKYVDGMNICAGELGKSGCKVRFKMQKFKIIIDLIFLMVHLCLMKIVMRG